MDVPLRSFGMEPDKLEERVKRLFLARMLPLIGNNFNLCKLGLAAQASPTCSGKFLQIAVSPPTDNPQPLICFAIRTGKWSADS